jgi:hypothetical protein
MLMGVLYAPACIVIDMRACTYIHIHGVGFCIAYSDIWVFSGPLPADKQERDPRFYLDCWNYSFPRLDKDLANSQIMSRWGFFM